MCCCTGGRSHRAGSQVHKSTNCRGGHLLANTGPKFCKLAPKPNICMHGEGEIGLLSQGIGSGLSPVRWGLDASCRATHTISGRESQLLRAILMGKLLVRPYIRILPLYSGCRLLPSPSGIGNKCLWSREGCGVGPNMYSTETGIRASATAGIPDRKLLVLPYVFILGPK